MYLMNGLAVAALALATTSCHKDLGGFSYSEEDALANAELQLGVQIDPNQDWKMTAEATANVSVFKDYGETYTVKVCSSNPVVDDVAYVLAQGTVENGKTFNQKFTYAAGQENLYIAVTDSKGFTSVSAVKVEDGEVNAMFGTPAVAAAANRSQAVPAVPDIKAPYDEAWVTTYCQTAKEPNSTNIGDNYDNREWINGTDRVWIVDVPASSTRATMGQFTWGYPANELARGADGYWKSGAWTAFTNDDKSFYNTYIKEAKETNLDYNNVEQCNHMIDLLLTAYSKCQETGRTDWLTLNPNDFVKGTITAEQGHWQEATEGYWKEDETFVLNFKITGTYSGVIGVAATEGYEKTYDQEKQMDVYTDKKDPYYARTIVVKGTWNITDDQRIGSGGIIVVANGGTVNVAEGKTLNMVNQAQLVVLPGGKLTGKGKVEVNNGNAKGKENYNGGTIDVATFNNNFGKFYNYGKFLVNEYHGGAQESNFYNHSLVAIDHFGIYDSSTANARIFNGCQFYVKNNARIRNYEGKQGSALIVGGELMFSSSMDGTSTPTYVGLEAGALVKCATLYNNGTSWTGPTEGYAALEITDKITYLNWEQDHPEQGGYFENNIYVKSATWDNVPDGNGMGKNATPGTIYYTQSKADYKMFSIVANCTAGGTNGVTKVQDAATYLLPADEDFALGVKGCTPGFTGEGVPVVTPNPIYSYAFEDTHNGDYDMNDVVLKVQEFTDGEGDDAVQKLRIKLVAIGATLNLNIRLYPAAEPGDGEVAHYAGDFTVLEYNNKTEVHEMLGVEQGMMYNTGWNGNKVRPITIVIEKGNYNPSALPIAIYSAEQGEIRLAGAGQAPYGVVIPKDWSWPTERTNIETSYNETSTTEGDQSFKNFAEHAGESQKWFNHPTNKVMNESSLGFNQ